MFKIIESVCAYADSDMSRFHMPGHKGKLTRFAKASAFDLTELDVSDNLYAPESGFAEALDIITDYYGTKATVISAHGATLPIFAAVYLYSKNNLPFLCSRKVHRSVINALALCGSNVCFLPDSGSGLDVCALDAALGTGSYSGLIVTSVDYYGRLESIPLLAEKCRKANVPLITDNSHGSHLFFDGGSLHPLKSGANAVIDSYHKTLPAMTGGALLHTMDFEREKVLDAFRLFASTSPSYIISLSVLDAFETMYNNGLALLNRLRKSVMDTKCALKRVGMLTADFENAEPYRFCTECDGLAGEYSNYLSLNNVQCEFNDGTYTVFIPSVMNDSSDFNKLIEASGSFAKTHKILPARVLSDFGHIPLRAVSIREAVFSDNVSVCLADAEGRVAAEALSPYPPGIPLITPGEFIDKIVINALAAAGFDRIKVLTGQFSGNYNAVL